MRRRGWHGLVCRQIPDPAIAGFFYSTHILAFIEKMADGVRDFMFGQNNVNFSTPMRYRNSLLALIAILPLSFVLASGAPEARDGQRATERPPLSLRIDPGFKREELPADGRIWYDRLSAAIKNSSGNKDITDKASKNDIHSYSRPMNNYLIGVLHALRVTGDKSLLDEVDRVTSLMRAQLKDSSIVVKVPPGETVAPVADGFLNWVRAPRTPLYDGTDVHAMDEMLTHSTLAEVAYTFQVNGNVDPKYAERTKFWKDYLLKHFEAKWRIRNEKPQGKFMENTLIHVYIAWTRYHYYMNLLTGQQWYRDEAERRAKVFAAQMIPMNNNTAYIWSHRVVGEREGDKLMIAQPTTYARYTAVSAADLAFEKFSIFTPEFMQKMAAGIREFIMDNGATDFAGDIAGDVQRANLPKAQTLHPRESLTKFAAGNFPELGAWDSTGKITSVSQEVYRKLEKNSENPRGVHLPSGILTAVMVQNGALRK